MSARWIRCSSATHRCGSCNAPLSVGVAVLEIQIPAVHRTRLRCEECAGPAPPDLPPFELPASIPERMAALTRVGQAAPKRTRGALQQAMVHTDRWSPHRND